MSSLAKKTSRWYYVISLLVLIGGWSLILFILFQWSISVRQKAQIASEP